jgi:superfamily I DNA/RNA helicase
MEFDARVQRDGNNAKRAKDAAKKEIDQVPSFAPKADFVHGTPGYELDLASEIEKQLSSLQEIGREPFHGMVEAVIFSDRERKVLWYANQHAVSNQVLSDAQGEIRIVTWTHPGFQVALASQLNEDVSLRGHGYSFRSVRPIARARFRAVLPEISGIYDPGGQIRPDGGIPKPAGTGLKAIKLDLTAEQVFAFINRMDGFLMVSGAPGTGKTTIALQRIRFLFDQQKEREPNERNVPYDPELSAVFLANQNLIDYSRRLLKNELQIPGRVVHLVPDFIHKYLDEVWALKLNARPRQRKISDEEIRAREAFFNLCKAADLAGLWKEYETQIKRRLAQARSSEWYADLSKKRLTLENAAALSDRLTRNVRVSDRPGASSLRMDSIYRAVRGPYDRCREPLKDASKRAFDLQFRNWLFWVYDPFDAVNAYFGKQLYQGRVRIQSGINLIDPDEVIENIKRDWSARVYGPEDESWFAWLLRFALPEDRAPEDRFREMPVAIPEPNHRTMDRLTHVVIDEAQDLSVQEASLLASFVHPRGSLTISADFHQVVSPVHGMTDAEALRFGIPITDQEAFKQYPFTKNMRQSREIGLFLVDFYKKVFHEFPSFDAGDRSERAKPTLYLGTEVNFPKLIQQMLAALARSQKIGSVAVLQVNEDKRALDLLRDKLKKLGVRLASPGVIQGQPGELITTDVEHAKGLEFDACVVLGLDDVERSALNFSRNRAYVALSRPTQRLYMLCGHFPPLLEKVEKDLYLRHDV